MPVYEPERDHGQRNLWLGLGIGCGCLVLLFAGMMVAVMLPVFSRARGTAQRVSCMANLEQLDRAVRLYQDDHNGRFPPAATWRQSLAKYLPDAQIFRCPADRDLKHPSSYAFNPHLSGLDGAALSNPSAVVALFETASPDADPTDPASWPTPGRHRLPGGGFGNNVAYADGHVDTKPTLEASDLQPKRRAP
jgi:prepilin-type processing-associated H-X9-DG protein